MANPMPPTTMRITPTVARSIPVVCTLTANASTAPDGDEEHADTDAHHDLLLVFCLTWSPYPALARGNPAAAVGCRPERGDAPCAVAERATTVARSGDHWPRPHRAAIAPPLLGLSRVGPGLRRRRPRPELPVREESPSHVPIPIWTPWPPSSPTSSPPPPTRSTAPAPSPGPRSTALGEAGLLGLVSAARGRRRRPGLLRRRPRDRAPGRAPAGRPPWSCSCTTPPPPSSRPTGPTDVREAIAAGRCLATLAFSEVGSRSHFWAPLGTATAAADDGAVRLDARKSWVTSAGEADVYVWSSRPVAADGPDDHLAGPVRRPRADGRPAASTASACGATSPGRSTPTA